MKKRNIKTILLLSMALSEITSTTVNAQKWQGNGSYMVRDLDDFESDKEIDEMDFDYELVMNWLTYKDLCCFNLDTGANSMADTWFPIAIYSSADRAINQIEAVESEKFYLFVADAKIKDAYQLVNGKPSLIEDVSILNEIDKDNLAFSLVQTDSNVKEQTVAYINGKDMVAMAYPCMKYYKEEKQLIKK